MDAVQAQRRGREQPELLSNLLASAHSTRTLAPASSVLADMVLSTALVSPDELGGLNYDKTFQHMFMRKLTRRVFGTHKQSTFGWRLITIATVLVASNYLI